MLLSSKHAGTKTTKVKQLCGSKPAVAHISTSISENKSTKVHFVLIFFKQLAVPQSEDWSRLAQVLKEIQANSD